MTSLPSTVRVRMDIAYDGTDFHGWAVQPGLRTVEGELVASLERVLRVPVRLVVAGRTDAGVHAARQVAHVDLPMEVLTKFVGHSGESSLAVVVRRLDGVLPGDLVVRYATPAPPGFDARFAALWRRYRYRICDEPAIRDPLSRRSVLWLRRRLDVNAMNEAARQLVGEHDFAAYCRPRPGSSTIRELQELTVDRSAYGHLEIWAQADAFCHSMVRSLVGALLDVGEGKRDPSYPAAILASRSRAGAGPVVPAHGLTLERVQYPEAAELAARVAQTRSGVRGASASTAMRSDESV